MNSAIFSRPPTRRVGRTFLDRLRAGDLVADADATASNTALLVPLGGYVPCRNSRLGAIEGESQVERAKSSGSAEKFVYRRPLREGETEAEAVELPPIDYSTRFWFSSPVPRSISFLPSRSPASFR